MSFNPSKCQVLHVTRLKTPIPSKYSLHNKELESVSAAKYLGVTIDRKKSTARPQGNSLQILVVPKSDSLRNLNHFFPNLYQANKVRPDSIIAQSVACIPLPLWFKSHQ